MVFVSNPYSDKKVKKEFLYHEDKLTVTTGISCDGLGWLAVQTPCFQIYTLGVYVYSLPPNQSKPRSKFWFFSADLSDNYRNES